MPKKTATKSIDDLKIVENVVHKANEMKCMKTNEMKTKKILCECIDKWCDKCVKYISTICFTNTICYARHQISKQS